MPGLNAQGPDGQGPGTGRGMGNCNPSQSKESRRGFFGHAFGRRRANIENDEAGRGQGRGRGRGRGRGMGQGRRAGGKQ